MAEVRIYENDLSIRPFVPSQVQVSKQAILVPLMAEKGPSNTPIVISSQGQMTREFGDEFLDIDRYGQSGAQAFRALQYSGVTLYAVRLMPDSATYASSIISCGIRVSNSIPKYQRDRFGDFVMDENGNRIPETDENGDPIILSGLEVKWEQQPVNFFVGSGINEEEVIRRNSMPYTDDDGFRVYPIFYMRHNALGTCGNKIRFNISAGSGDARRAVSRTYNFQAMELTPAGNMPIMENVNFARSVEFSLDPKATAGVGLTNPMDFNVVYPLEYTEALRIREAKLMAIVYSENYEEIKEEYLSRFADSLPEDIDFLFCRNRDGQLYDNFVLTSDSIDFANTATVSLINGSDGEFAMDEEFTDADGNLYIIDQDSINAAYHNLLVRLFSYDLIPALLDVNIWDFRYVFDANFPFEVKSVLLNMNSARWNREQIFLFMDGGITRSATEAVQMAQRLSRVIPDREKSYKMCYNGTAGMSCDDPSQKPYEVTINYDLFQMFFRLQQTMKFAAFSGLANDAMMGAVRPFWTMAVTVNNTMRRELERNKVNYVKFVDEPDAGRNFSRHNFTGQKIAYVNNMTLYSPNGASKLTEPQNGALMCHLNGLFSRAYENIAFLPMDDQITKLDEIVEDIRRNEVNVNIQVDYVNITSAQDRIENRIVLEVNVSFPDVGESATFYLNAVRRD